MKKVILCLLLIFFMTSIALADQNKGTYTVTDLLKYLIYKEHIKLESKKLAIMMYKRILYWQEQIKIDEPKLEPNNSLNEGRC